MLFSNDVVNILKIIKHKLTDFLQEAVAVLGLGQVGQSLPTRSSGLAYIFPNDNAVILSIIAVPGGR